MRENRHEEDRHEDGIGMSIEQPPWARVFGSWTRLQAWGREAISLHIPSQWRKWKPRWSGRRTERLRLADSLSLGDRRSAAILEIEGRRFLIGTTPQAVTLLAELQGHEGSEPKGAAEEFLHGKDAA